MTRVLVALSLLLATAAAAAPSARTAVRAALDALGPRGNLLVLWPTHADTPRHVSGPLAPARASAAEAVARSFLGQSGALFGLRDAARELRLHAVVPTAAGTAVRFVQEHRGLPVYGAHLVIMVDARGRVVLAQSSLRTARPTLPTAVVEVALARSAVAAQGALPGRAHLVALPVGDDLRACWVVWGRTVAPFGIFDYFVDATTGRVIGQRSRLVNAKGRVYANSPAQGNPGLIDAELLHLTATDKLKGDYVDSFRGTLTGYDLVAERKAVPVNGDYLFDPQEPSFTDPFAEVQMYYHVTRIHQWMLDTFQFQRTTRGAEQFITTFANFAQGNGSGGLSQYDNAFYGDADGDGKGDLAFGQGGVDFSYDAEVIYHEFAHSMIDEGPKLDGIDIDPLGLNMDPASLNEAYADYFSSTFVGDPLLGDYVGQTMGGTIRQLVDPVGEHLVCRDVPLMGESHDDGMPWSRGLWDVRTTLGAAKADQAVWASLHTLQPDASFSDAATALVAVVQQLYGAADAATVKATLDDRNLTECPRLFELRHGAERTGYVFGHQTVGNFQVPHALQYFVQVPASATRLTFSARGQGAQGGRVTLIPLVRKSDPVLVSQSGYNVTYQADVTGQANRDLVLTPDSATAPLVPGQTHYLLVTNNGEDDMVFDLSVSLSTTPLPQHDAGVADAGHFSDGPRGDAPGGGGDGGVHGDGGEVITPGRGCSCRAGGATAAAPLLLCALLGLTLLRTRRRR